MGISHEGSKRDEAILLHWCAVSRSACWGEAGMLLIAVLSSSLELIENIIKLLLMLPEVHKSWSENYQQINSSFGTLPAGVYYQTLTPFRPVR